MTAEPRLELLYLLANPKLSSQAQVAVTLDASFPTLNTLQIHIQNPDASPVVEMENVARLTPEDPIPGAEQSYTGPRLDRLYVYFPWGPESGRLATRELAAAFTLSPAPDNSTWWVSPMSSPDLGPYWALFPQTEAILRANESVRFVLSGVQTLNPPESTTTFIVDKRVTGYRDQTDRDTPVLLMNAAPVITSLAAVPPRVPPGDVSKVSWTTWNAQSVTLNPGEGHELPPNGSLDVYPTRSTTYVLEAFSPVSQLSRREPVTVTVDPVEIESFTADPAATIPGYPVQLSWRTRSAVAASISPDIGSVPVNGTVRGPARVSGTTYVLRADGEKGPVERKLEVGITNALRFSTLWQQGDEGFQILFQLLVRYGSPGALVSLSLEPPLPDGTSRIDDVPIPPGSTTYLVGFQNFVPAGYEGRLNYSYNPLGTVTSADLSLEVRGVIPVSPGLAARDMEDALDSDEEPAAGESWDDLYLRANLEDQGAVPRKAPWNHSPDLIPSGILPVDHPARVFDRSYDQELARSLVAQTPNYIYLRVKNFAAQPRRGRLYLYYTPSQLLLYPQLWSQNVLRTSSGSDWAELHEVRPGKVATIGDPFVFNPTATDQSMLLIGRLETPEHPNPVPSSLGGETFDEWISKRGNWARFDAVVTNEGAAAFTRQIPFDMGDIGGSIEFLLSCRNLPTGSEVWATSGTLLPDGTYIIIPPSTIPGPGDYGFGTVAEVPVRFQTTFQVCYRGQSWGEGASLSLKALFTPDAGKARRVIQEWEISAPEDEDSDNESKGSER
jgi:hypothetical protein